MIERGSSLRRGIAALLLATAAAAATHAQQTESKSPAAQTAPADPAPASETPPAAKPEAAEKPPQLPAVHVNGGPSDDILRSAREAGFKIKIAGGTTHFCKTEAPIGTRFANESCMNEQQVTLWLERAQAQRDKMKTMLGAPAVSH